jgi:predicted transcriptional regulator
MLLVQIKKLLQQRQQMSLTDLARHFYVSENVMLSMLQVWQKKGRIEVQQQSGLCKSTCGSCDESNEVNTYYRWKKVAEKPIFTKTSQA